MDKDTAAIFMEEIATLRSRLYPEGMPRAEAFATSKRFASENRECIKKEPTQLFIKLERLRKLHKLDKSNYKWGYEDRGQFILDKIVRRDLAEYMLNWVLNGGEVKAGYRAYAKETGMLYSHIDLVKSTKIFYMESLLAMFSTHDTIKEMKLFDTYDESVLKMKAGNSFNGLLKHLTKEMQFMNKAKKNQETLDNTIEGILEGVDKEIINIDYACYLLVHKSKLTPYRVGQLLNMCHKTAKAKADRLLEKLK